MGGWGSLLTLAIVIGLLKSFPPCIRNPHGVVGSCLSSFASKVRSDILSRVTTSTKYLSTESRSQHKLVCLFPEHFLTYPQILHTAQILFCPVQKLSLVTSITQTSLSHYTNYKITTATMVFLLLLLLLPHAHLCHMRRF